MSYSVYGIISVSGQHVETGKGDRCATPVGSPHPSDPGGTAGSIKPRSSRPLTLRPWGRKGELASRLKRMAFLGFHAAAYNLWQYGKRGTEDRDSIMSRVFRQLFPANMAHSGTLGRGRPKGHRRGRNRLRASHQGLHERDLRGRRHIVAVFSLDRRIECGQADTRVPPV
jgi:hypothetical protein